MMPLIDIKFQCYIPKSLGISLMDQFKKDLYFNKLKNKAEFIEALESNDCEGYTWLQEPGASLSHQYFSTDNVGFQTVYDGNASYRLGFNGEINPRKIGKYTYINGVRMGNQGIGESNQVQAYIKRIGYYDDEGPEYIGICNDTKTKMADSAPSEIKRKNFLSNTYCHPKGTNVGNDTTIFTVEASSGYPFIEPFSPNIDFELEIKAIKDSSKNIRIMVNGYHNEFPAYQLVINNKIIYSYNPEEYGHKGPGLINLNKSVNFKAREYIRLLGVY